MKIVQIISYYPPHLGGMENVAKEISESLAKRGHQVKVFTSDIGCPKNKQLKSIKNLKINYLKSWEFSYIPVIRSLYNELVKIPKDSIMHVHVAQAFIPEIVYLVSKIKKIPYITHIHGDTKPSGKFGFLLSLYKREMDKFNEWGKLENVLSYVSKRKNLKYLANSELITNI